MMPWLSLSASERLCTWLPPKSRYYDGRGLSGGWLQSLAINDGIVHWFNSNCISVGLHLVQLTLSQSFFSSFPFTVAMCTCRFFSCLFTRPSIPQNHVSLHPPPFGHTHIVYSNLKDSPCVMQAVSPPFHFISLPFSSLFCRHPP